MAKKRSIFQRFFRQLETGDDHFDEDLKSHYYKTSFEKVFNATVAMFENDPNYEITSKSKERGEIGVRRKKGPSAFIVATVVQVRPFETACDFMISSDRFSLFGLYPTLKKLALEFYRELNKELPFRGKKK